MRRRSGGRRRRGGCKGTNAIDVDGTAGVFASSVVGGTIGMAEKWRLGLAHVRPARRAGFHLSGVVADPDHGSTAAFRAGVEREGLKHTVAIRSNLTMWTPGARRTRTAAAISWAVPPRSGMEFMVGFQRDPPLRG